MPNIAVVLKAEIARIARKESKATIVKTQKTAIKARKALAAIRKRLTQIEKHAKQLASQMANISTAQPANNSSATDTARITSKGVRSLRKKLGLTRAQFARLAGTSDQTVYNWENKQGALKFRGGSKAAVLAMRGMGAREAKKHLEKLATRKKTPGKRRAKR